MANASTIRVAPSTCLRRSPGMLLRRLSVRPCNGLLLHKLIDFAVACERLLELIVNGLNLADENGLRFHDRAPEILTSRCCQQFTFGRNLVERIRQGEPGWWRGIPRPLVGLPIHREQSVCGAVKM